MLVLSILEKAEPFRYPWDHQRVNNDVELEAIYSWVQKKTTACFYKYDKGLSSDVLLVAHVEEVSENMNFIQANVTSSLKLKLAVVAKLL